MTCGIYKLKFSGTDKVYIGQSVNIEIRYRQHIRNIQNNTCSQKLYEAYITYGTPSLEILSECLIEELDTQEDECIDIYNSVDNGFNIYYTANEAPTYNNSYGYGNTKYPKELIEEAFHLLVDTNDTHINISRIVGIPVGTVSGISLGIHHIWLKELYPEKFAILKSKVGNRQDYSIISNKLSAGSRGIEYPPIKSPEGVVHTITNAYSFAKENGLAPNHFQEVLNKHRKSHKGWRLA